MGSAGTGCTDSKIDASQFEDGGEVHGDRRIHALKDGSRTHQRGIFFVSYFIIGLHYRFGCTVISIKDTNLIFIYKFLVNIGIF